jgi:zinc finger-containing ubiquitin peptidase 1
MPSKLRRQLEEGGKVTYRTQISANGTLVKVPVISNETQNLIFTMSQLCSADENVDQAWLCHPGIRHVGKQGKEGGFCGYRNIQMLISYIQAVKLPGQPFGEAEKGVPNIFRLQDWIEEGWDEGINANGRIETGGIRGTRKYIGTSEVTSLLAVWRRKLLT